MARQKIDGQFVTDSWASLRAIANGLQATRIFIDFCNTTGDAVEILLALVPSGETTPRSSDEWLNYTIKGEETRGFQVRQFLGVGDSVRVKVSDAGDTDKITVHLSVLEEASDEARKKAAPRFVTDSWANLREIDTGRQATLTLIQFLNRESSEEVYAYVALVPNGTTAQDRYRWLNYQLRAKETRGFICRQFLGPGDQIQVRTDAGDGDKVAVHLSTLEESV